MTDGMVFKKAGFPCAFLIVCTAITLMACSTEGKAVVTPTPDRSPEIRTGMEKYNQCFSQMNADCMASLFAPNGEIYATGLLQASGPGAVKGYLDQAFNSALLDSLSATIDSTVINGDVAVVRGTYDEKTSDSSGKNNETKLLYTAEWIAQSDGQWLLSRISTIPSPPTQTGTP